MKQKLQDLMLRLRHEKKAQTIGAFILVGLMVMYFNDGTPHRPRPQREAERKDLSQSRQEAATDVVTAVTQQMDRIESEQNNLKKQVTETQASIEDDRVRMSEILKKMIDKLAEKDQMAGQMVANQGMPGIEPVSMGPDGQAQVSDTFASFGDQQSTEVAPPPPPPLRKKVVIMPGDTLRVRLLSGVHAPTDGTPYPVVVEAVGDVQGPDGASLPIGKARFVVAAQGSLSDSRALFRLTTMNIRLPNGQKQEVPVDGWLVGEDGIRGLEGVLLDPLGKAIGAAMEAGALQGIGEGFAAKQTSTQTSFFGGTTTTVSGDPLKFAAGKGVSAGANELVSMIKQRAALLVPHVEVYSGREATAVFSKTVTIDGLFEALEDNDTSFASTVD